MPAYHVNTAACDVTSAACDVTSGCTKSDGSENLRLREGGQKISRWTLPSSGGARSPPSSRTPASLLAEPFFLFLGFGLLILVSVTLLCHAEANNSVKKGSAAVWSSSTLFDSSCRVLFYCVFALWHSEPCSCAR